MDTIKHGLDLPNEEVDKQREALLKKFNITEEELNEDNDEENQ